MIHWQYLSRIAYPELALCYHPPQTVQIIVKQSKMIFLQTNIILSSLPENHGLEQDGIFKQKLMFIIIIYYYLSFIDIGINILYSFCNNSKACTLKIFNISIHSIDIFKDIFNISLFQLNQNNSSNLSSELYDVSDDISESESLSDEE